jgi:GST-like protein
MNSSHLPQVTLHGRPGWGSALIEPQLVYYGLPYTFESVGDLFASAAARSALTPLNPLAQVPVLQIGTEQVMTESAAITLHLADLVRRDDLVPAPDAQERGLFLRWLIYLVANIYPSFAYVDDPSRFITMEEARQPFRDAVAERQRALWLHVEHAAGAPWFLGDRFSALDMFIGVMSRWRPGRKWFEAEAPKLLLIAHKVDKLPDLREVWSRNFPAR